MVQMGNKRLMGGANPPRGPRRDPTENMPRAGGQRPQQISVQRPQQGRGGGAYPVPVPVRPRPQMPMMPGGGQMQPGFQTGMMPPPGGVAQPVGGAVMPGMMPGAQPGFKTGMMPSANWQTYPAVQGGQFIGGGMQPGMQPPAGGQMQAQQSGGANSLFSLIMQMAAERGRRGF